MTEEAPDRRKAQRADAQTLRDAMREMVKTQGWQILEATAKMQITNRVDKLMLEPTESIASENFMKGEVAMLRTMLSLPAKILDESLQVLDLFKKESEG